MRRPLAFALAIVAMLLVVCPASAQETKKPSYDDPQHTDADFPFTGEYQGVLPLDEGDLKFGTQVVARGNGKFDVVSYVGALPGDGWNREAPSRFQAERQGDRIRVDAENGYGI